MTKKESEVVNVMIILLVGNVTNVMKIILCPRASVTSVTNHARLVSITVNDQKMTVKETGHVVTHVSGFAYRSQNGPF